ncbi:hypothetical protein MBLNU13_g10218t1 [Cladosporium sp. NU13]
MPTEAEVEAGRDEIARRLQQLHKLHLAQRQPRHYLQMRNMEGEGETLSSLATTVTGRSGSLQSAHQAARQEAHVASVAEMATTRITRRAQSYFNTFQTTCAPAQDDPPSYATASRLKAVAGREIAVGREALPQYSCTVSAGARMLVNMESVSPLHMVSMSEWRDIWVEVRGTMLNFHRVKDCRPSRLLRSYTLQHAEIGLAPDVCHTVLAPNSKLAHLIPSAARQKAFRKDPQLFRAEEQYIMRLRVESDQILLAHKSEDKILEMVHEIGAGIDLAPAIDERNISKQCTVPRRRRRPNTQTAADISSAAVIAEQERILQQMYPSFAQDTTEQNPAPTPAASTSVTPLGTPTREDDELDLSAIREDFTESSALTQTTTSASTSPDSNGDRPSYSRTTTASLTSSAIQTTYETAPSNFSPEGKWQPPHLRTAVQIRRYVRRCAPLLLSDAVRASDIVICNGKRMRINWREERLEDWRLQPPTYQAHDFEKEQQRKEDEAGATTAAQQNNTDTALSLSRNTTSSNAPSSVFSETSSHDDSITPLEERSEQAGGLAHLDLVKSSSSGSAKGMAEPPTTSTTTTPVSRQKAREVQRDNNTADAQSIVFCF